MSLLYTLVAETHHEELAPIIMPPIAFAIVAAVVFIGLALVTFSYRDVANRHSDKVGDAPEGGHGHH
ncbi:hypothetical protein [Homoserinibacter sp. YIM 151385]|uniref:hypothetical protein n=1 Tax=Homoserinibacter sp. YIM 151385 TaxID=2985506 RepID=UPI0022F0561C|nr:hypothetical protein [Homoserinibacter sp. YIM 151385]WBU38979.1 hypothetical protein OF852_05205 [Homoserinibacter sp. YIM 151385]